MDYRWQFDAPDWDGVTRLALLRDQSNGVKLLASLKLFMSETNLTSYIVFVNRQGGWCTVKEPGGLPAAISVLIKVLLAQRYSCI